MAYIFIDESGDLGFKESSSSWFLFTILLTNNHRPIEKVIKKVHAGLKKKYKCVNELHAYHADSLTRKKVLAGLSGIKDLKVLCVILNKKKVYTDLQNQKNHLYNYTANILLDRLHGKSIIDIQDVVKVCIDKKDTNKRISKNFEAYLGDKLSTWGHKDIHLSLRSSQNEKCLQAVDFISWAIFRKYERGESEYYDILKDKIIEENILFP